MLIGVPKEIKNHEYRIGLTPAGVRELEANGHQVVVQRDGGKSIGLTDEMYRKAGADIWDSAEEIFAKCDMIIKVKEPQPQECAMLRPGQLLYTYLHLAPDPEQTAALVKSGAVCVAYETITGANGGLPLLAPMSEVAGRMAPQVGAHHLQRDGGGRGVLMGGVSGVYAAKVVVLGAGVSGMNAAAIALGMQAEVLLLDKNVARLREVDRIYQGHMQTVASNSFEVERACLDADLVIGAVLVPGAKAPTLVTDDLVSRMKPGSVLVDISVDQGGCFESTRPTTHADPTFKVHDSVFYCVANMPGAVPHTSTYALTNVTLPYAVELANKGWKAAVGADKSLWHGVNAVEGAVVYDAVAEAHGLTHVPLETVLA